MLVVPVALQEPAKMLAVCAAVALPVHEQMPEPQGFGDTYAQTNQQARHPTRLSQDRPTKLNQ